MHRRDLGPGAGLPSGGVFLSAGAGSPPSALPSSSSLPPPHVPTAAAGLRSALIQSCTPLTWCPAHGRCGLKWCRADTLWALPLAPALFCPRLTVALRLPCARSDARPTVLSHAHFGFGGRPPLPCAAAAFSPAPRHSYGSSLGPPLAPHPVRTGGRPPWPLHGSSFGVLDCFQP